MRWVRIYDALMERAQHRRPHASGLERHHILPLCLGGGREADNEVWLTPREHIAAHALLVRMVPDCRPAMLASLVSTINARRRNSAAAERARGVYAGLIGEQTALHAGTRHHGHRSDVYRLAHDDGRSLDGTRMELIAASGVPFRQLYDLVNGRRPQAHGWRISD
jgi:hypothetical protein